MNTEQKQEVQVHIRWMLRRDLPEILEIEEESFEFPWLEKDFSRCLRQRNCIGIVAVVGSNNLNNERVVGFMVYQLFQKTTCVLDFAVHFKWRRRGIGSQMIAKLIEKSSIQQRQKI